MDNNIGIVLIPGAGLGSWVWNDLNSLLNYPVLAVDFPNRGDKTGANKLLKLADYTRPIIQEMEAWNTPQLIIVAHSAGGVIGLKVAEYFKEQVIGFVGVGATIPANGNSFLATLPLFKRILLSLILRLAGTKPPESAIKAGLCNDLSPEMAEKVVCHFVPESPALYLEKCRATIPPTKCLYVKLTNDKDFPESLQDQMIINLRAQAATLYSGHLPMLSCPTELAHLLNQFVTNCAS